MRRTIILLFASVWLASAASTGSVHAMGYPAGYTVLEYSDTDFTNDILWWSSFVPYMDPDELPPRPEQHASVYVGLMFYAAPGGSYHGSGSTRWGQHFLDVPGPADGDFSISFSVDAAGQIHSVSFSGRLGSGADYFSWYTSGYHFQYEYCDVTWEGVTWEVGDPDGPCTAAGGYGEMDGTWSIIDSAPPPSPAPPAAIPLPATSTLLLSGMLLAASARLARRGRSGRRA